MLSMLSLQNSALPLLAIYCLCSMFVLSGTSGCSEETATEAPQRLQLLLYHEQGLGLPFSQEAKELSVSAIGASGKIVQEETIDVSEGKEGRLSSLPFDIPIHLQISLKNSAGKTLATGSTRAFTILTEGKSLNGIVFLSGVESVSTASAPFGFAEGTEIRESLYAGPGRAHHTATKLADGRVIIAGGISTTSDDAANTLDSILLYDPMLGYFDEVLDVTGTPLKMGTARAHHSATLLSDGSVLLLGGRLGDQALSDAELLLPRSNGTFELVPLDPMTTPRASHIATRRADGRVLIIGGERFGDDSATLSSLELFDPSSLQFLPMPAMNTPRKGHQALLLPDGESVLIIGGDDGTSPSASLELFTLPEGGVAKIESIGEMQKAREGHQAILLEDQRHVMIAGGRIATEAGTRLPTDSLELFDTKERVFLTSGEMGIPRADFNMQLLPTGNEVLIAGGLSSVTGEEPLILDEVEILTYDPNSFGLLTRTLNGRMSVPRRDAKSIQLDSGVILITGGRDNNGAHRSTSLFNPGF